MAQAKELPEIKALGAVLSALKDLDQKQQTWVISSAMSNLGAPVPLAPGALQNPTNQFTPAQNTNVAGEPGSKPHAKAFMRLKLPNSDVQRVACLAYYLATFRDLPLFKTKEISEMNTYAAGTSLSNASKTVDNATKKNKFFAPAGKGAKQLTSLGELVVDALPDQQAVLNVIATSSPKRKPKRKAKKSKA